jgi:uncharacterized protein YjbJ (UPF0337 family)
MFAAEIKATQASAVTGGLSAEHRTPAAGDCGPASGVTGNFPLAQRLKGASQPQEATAMDKDRIKGSAKQIKGAVKEVAGKVTGDTKLQAEGKADKAEGKIQNTVGGVKDALRGK